LGWCPAPTEEPVAGSVRWHTGHPADEPDVGFAVGGEALAQAK